MMNFSGLLLHWYRKSKRDLPWRHSKDPYQVWLSEIIMQQTRIEQGTPYYLKFITNYPTIADLAAADEQEVLKLWQGLGYYSRARNLHATARLIAGEHAGRFPDSHEMMLKLKGIGDYTAAAIASICFDQPYAVVDGNVMRFISRVFGVTESIDLPGTKKKIHAIAMENLDCRNPGDYNQAMMEFGATICTPANPACDRCIFKTHCVAYNDNRVEEIPARLVKPGVRQRYLHYAVVTMTLPGENFIYMNKRTGNDIWKNLYDFPCLEPSPGMREEKLSANEFSSVLNGADAAFMEVSGVKVHLLSHQRILARFYHFHFTEMVELPFILVPFRDLEKLPVPKLIERYISESL